MMISSYIQPLLSSYINLSFICNTIFAGQILPGSRAVASHRVFPCLALSPPSNFANVGTLERFQRASLLADSTPKSHWQLFNLI